jgi:hypothetical protein
MDLPPILFTPDRPWIAQLPTTRGRLHPDHLRFHACSLSRTLHTHHHHYPIPSSGGNNTDAIADIHLLTTNNHLGGITNSHGHTNLLHQGLPAPS